jgi:hypothetical protein
MTRHEMILVAGFNSNRSVEDELECVGDEIAHNLLPQVTVHVHLASCRLDLSPGRSAAPLRSLLKSSSENIPNLARGATKDYQGFKEKIAPVSVKSLTARYQSEA